ncbi:MAG: glycosyltransferase [Patescibacteria group bacterium]
MKLLYLAYSRLPTEKAHGLQIMKTCEALAVGGAEVELVVPVRRNSIIDEPFGYYDIEKKFVLRQLQTPDWVQWGMFGFVLSVALFAESARFLPSFWKADYIYSRDALLLVQYILLGRPLVFEAHQPPNRLRLFVAKRARRLVVISKPLADVYIKKGVRAERVIVAGDGVDIKKFAPQISKEAARSTLLIHSTEPIALYTGHLYKRKGVHTLAEAARLSGVQTYFVGGVHEDVIRFQKLCQGVTNIHVMGHKPPSDMPLWLRAADMLVLPNSGKNLDSSTYTSPMKLGEYIASRTPIIASKVPALESILGTSATWVEPDSASALAAALKRSHQPTHLTPYSWDDRAKTIISSLQ